MQRLPRTSRGFAYSRFCHQQQPGPEELDADPCGANEHYLSPRLLACVQELSKILAEQLSGTSIYLIGLMGTGKSTAGRIIAKALGYYFFDTDELIEKLTSELRQGSPRAP